MKSASLLDLWDEMKYSHIRRLSFIHSVICFKRSILAWILVSIIINTVWKKPQKFRQRRLCTEANMLTS